jgi:FlaA1/EpsC-like NDP-sugar epimerase
MAIEMSPGDLEQLPDRISDMFRGQTIFITGGSGFLGKVLIEKLLRTCPGVKTIYLLLRSKKGKSPHERISDIFNNMVGVAAVKKKFFLINQSGLNAVPQGVRWA